MILTGERTKLREFRLDDADDCAAIIGDDRVTTFMSFDSRPHEAAVALMEQAAELAAVDPRTEFYMGITSHDNDTVIGFIRLALTGVKAAKLGYAVHADHWRHGYASDAASTMVKFGFETLGLHRITAAIGPVNKRSIALVERIGFKYEGHLRDHVLPTGTGATACSTRYSHLTRAMAGRGLGTPPSQSVMIGWPSSGASHFDNEPRLWLPDDGSPRSVTPGGGVARPAMLVRDVCDASRPRDKYVDESVASVS